MFPDSPAMREQDRLTAEAFADPRPGDRFHEMFSAWVVVVSVDGYTVMLADRGLPSSVGGWLDRATEVPAAPTHPKPPPAAAPDPLGDGLDAIEARNEHRNEAQKLTEGSVAG